MNSTIIATDQYETGTAPHIVDGEGAGAWLEVLFERTRGHGAFRLNDEGRIASWSRSAETLFGFGAQEIVGENYAVLFDRSDAQHDLPERLLAQIHGESGAIKQTCQLVRKGGVSFRAACEIVRLPAPPGGFGVIVSDCSPQIREHHALDKVVRSFRSLRQTTRIRDRFLHVVAHELRTPLQAILGWVRLLRAGKLDAKASGHALEVIERSSRTQARLIENLLDVSLLAAGSLQISTTRINLVSALGEVLGSVHNAAAAKTLELDAQLEGDYTVCGDPVRLGRAFGVLLQYAIHGAAPNSQIKLGISSANNAAEIAIHAEGLLLPAVKLTEIFDDPVCDLGAPGKPSVGPGLAIVRHIVELHKGAISAEPDGSGVRFVVRLPLA